jgi:tetratricopeptide (TPR) repeat protein
MKKTMLFALLMLFIVSLVNAQVTVTESWVDISSYELGPEDPNPPLWDEKVYPYAMQTDLGSKPSPKKYLAVTLENQYIRVIILPDLGGKILAAHDKTNNDFDFIYQNHVVKPGLVALRGAWLSGGIEWNFPTWGHTVNTFSPVNYHVEKNDDGSITCTVGTEEFVRRMRWSVDITVHPDRSYFQTDIRLYNPTLTHNNGYYWSNAATHAWDDTRAVFPPSNYTFFGARRSPRDWPIFEGKDVTWYTNTVSSADFFCASAGEYNGSYNYDHENGTVHVADGGESPGKKFWTWGYSPRGELWEDQLTDADGAYIEVQSGRLVSQVDAWMFEPHLVEQWEEFWYPVKNMHGFVKANADATINFENNETELHVALNTTKVYQNCLLEVFANDKNIFNDSFSIAPEGGYSKNIPIEHHSEAYIVVVKDQHGAEIINYSTVKPEIPEPELMPDMDDQDVDTAETRFLRGYYALKNWNRGLALEYFESSLELDPGFTKAHKWSGIVKYKIGKYAEAIAHLDKVLRRNEDDYAARYYRALSKLKLGIMEHTAMDLQLVSRRAEYRHVAPYLLAGIEIENGNLDAAIKFLEQAITANPKSVNAKAMLSALLRNQGKGGEAAILSQQALKDDPLASIAAIELALGGNAAELKRLRGNPQIYLEVAIAYKEMNLLDDAISILELAETNWQQPNPILLYYLAYYHYIRGELDIAGHYINEATELPTDYVFPSRKETVAVLKYAVGANPKDWQAHYYLGNLLTANLQWQAGLEFYLRAETLGSTDSVLYRNIGTIFRDKKKDRDKAEEYFAKAVESDPNDFRLYAEFDELLFLNNSQDLRQQLHSNVPDAVAKKAEYRLAKAQYQFDSSNFRDSLATLANTVFKPWEGNANTPRQIYKLSWLAIAKQQVERGELRQALKSIEKLMEFPAYLGTEQPADPVLGLENYILADLLQRQGEEQKAKSILEKLANAKTSGFSQDALFHTAATMELGKKTKTGQNVESFIEGLKGNESNEVNYLLGLAHFLKGDQLDSEKYAELATSAAPENRKYRNLKLVYRLLAK